MFVFVNNGCTELREKVPRISQIGQDGQPVKASTHFHSAIADRITRVHATWGPSFYGAVQCTLAGLFLFGFNIFFAVLFTVLQNN